LCKQLKVRNARRLRLAWVSGDVGCVGVIGGWLIIAGGNNSGEKLNKIVIAVLFIFALSFS
jgi:hypothetical protein